MANIFKLPQHPWHQPGELEIALPDDWRVEVCNMAGYNRPALSDEQIREAIINPIGIPRIRDLARGKKEVVIIFDDIHRVTRISRIAPHLIQELEEAGVPDSNIRFIAATGCHAPMNLIDFTNKLGKPVMARFPVYNHNPYENCTYIGTTSRGVKVNINTEVMNCDFKIGICSPQPHITHVFSGGSKIILPGVASIDTIYDNHTLEITNKTDYKTNEWHADADEAAELAGLDVIIGSIFNVWGDTVALFAGDPVAAYEACIQEAKDHYGVHRAENKDIVIANSYVKVTESVAALACATSLKEEGGDLVLLCNAIQGQVVHYLFGPFGKTIRGRHNFFPLPVDSKVNRLILFTEYPDITSLGYIENSDKVMQITSMEEVLKILTEHHKKGANVAIYPNADIPYFI